VIHEKYGSHMQILDWALHMDDPIFMNVMFSLQMMVMV